MNPIAIFFKLSKFFDVSIDYLLCATDEREKILPYQLKASEYEHIEKYRSLDPLGQSHVGSVLSWESERKKALADAESKISALQAASSACSAPVLSELRPEKPYYIAYYQKLASAGRGEYLFNDIPTDLM